MAKRNVSKLVDQMNELQLTPDELHCVALATRGFINYLKETFDEHLKECDRREIITDRFRVQSWIKCASILLLQSKEVLNDQV